MENLASKSEKKNFSIIIPHKNLPDLLQRCIDSIPQRNDMEIIIVDDNSDSGIVDFNSFPGSSKNGIKVIFDKQGKGAGAARNIGIRAATGKWLLFADCDDTYTSEFNKFLDTYAYSTSDIVLYKANVVSGQFTKKIVPNMNIFIDRFLRKKDNVADLKYGAWEPWNRMIKAGVVKKNEIWFDEISSSNDKMFSLRLGQYLESVEVSDKVVYNYILRPNSIIHSGKEKRFRNSFNTILEQNALYHNVGYKRKYFMPYFFLINYHYVDKDIIKEYAQYLNRFKANPFEGLVHHFFFNLLKKYKIIK